MRNYFLCVLLGIVFEITSGHSDLDTEPVDFCSHANDSLCDRYLGRPHLGETHCYLGSCDRYWVHWSVNGTYSCPEPTIPKDNATTNSCLRKSIDNNRNHYVWLCKQRTPECALDQGVCGPNELTHDIGCYNYSEANLTNGFNASDFCTALGHDYELSPILEIDRQHRFLAILISDSAKKEAHVYIDGSSTPGSAQTGANRTNCSSLRVFEFANTGSFLYNVEDVDCAKKLPVLCRRVPEDIRQLEKAKYCDEYVAPANGKATAGEKRVGEFISITCNEGYELDESGSKRCTVGGLWTGKPVTCTHSSNEDVSSMQLTAVRSYGNLSETIQVLLIALAVMFFLGVLVIFIALYHWWIVESFNYHILGRCQRCHRSEGRATETRTSTHPNGAANQAFRADETGNATSDNTTTEENKKKERPDLRELYHMLIITDEQEASSS